jgi:glycosyltransferase involved in cell wall biosynthesis
MRIALTADPELPVPPKLYGGIERIIDTLIRGLVERGHEVTLFANPASQTPCNLVPYVALNGDSKKALLDNLRLVSSIIFKGEYDVVHSFGRLAYLLPILPSSLPKLMSYQRSITPRSVFWSERLARGSLHFAGCSRRLIKDFAGRANWHVVYNGVPLSTYAFQRNVNAEAPLVFLGRIEEIKGPQLAIEIARQTGRRLVLAGNVPNESKHLAFFETEIAPHIDGRQIEYAGPVNDEQKNQLLGQAAALLMPILWEEPFGIVMAEALACGTPVIGLRRGSVPEIVNDGVTGFVCESVAEMVIAVSRLAEVDRQRCRQLMEEKFSGRVMTEAYEALYTRMVAGAARGKTQLLTGTAGVSPAEPTARKASLKRYSTRTARQRRSGGRDARGPSKELLVKLG